MPKIASEAQRFAKHICKLLELKGAGQRSVIAEEFDFALRSELLKAAEIAEAHNDAHTHEPRYLNCGLAIANEIRARTYAATRTGRKGE